MNRMELWQLLINMGSELELDDELAKKYRPLKSQGLVDYVNGKIYKTPKGRRAVINYEIIVE